MMDSLLGRRPWKRPGAIMFALGIFLCQAGIVPGGARHGNGGRSGERGCMSSPFGYASRKEMTCLTCQTFQPQFANSSIPSPSLAPCAVDPSPSDS